MQDNNENEVKDTNEEKGTSISGGDTINIDSVDSQEKPFNLSHEDQKVDTTTNDDREEPLLKDVDDSKKNTKVVSANSSMKKKLIISPFPKNYDKVESVISEQRAYLIESGAKTEKEQLSVMTGVAFGLLGCYDELAEIVGIEKLNEMINKPLIVKPRLV